MTAAVAWQPCNSILDISLISTSIPPSTTQQVVVSRYTMTQRHVVALLLSLTAPQALAACLGAYNVDPSSVSVSGLSSGGFMAAQLGVAYSDVFKTGFGVFAGGPYDCARNQPVGNHAFLQVVLGELHANKCCAVHDVSEQPNVRH